MGIFDCSNRLPSGNDELGKCDYAQTTTKVQCSGPGFRSNDYIEL